MFKGASSKQRIASHYDSLIFGRELIQQADATFRLSALEQLGYDGELACIAFDPLQSLLAAATQSGRITVYARHGVPKCSWSIKPSQTIKHLIFKSGTPYVIIVDAKSTLHVYDLSELDDRGEPARLFAHSLRSLVNCIEYIPSLSHIFLGCADGSVDTFDVDRLAVSPFRIKNLWVDQDELLRRSGVLNAPPKKRIPACTDLKTHPLDPNLLLIAYEGGIVLYNLTEHSLLRTYEYLVLPGAPGGHNDQTESAFLERRPSCSCLAWRPDGKMFVSGHEDGSIVFWSVDDGDRPIMARTVAMEDVNLASSSNLFGDNASAPASDPTEMREPIFKLAWSGFSDTSSVLERFSASKSSEINTKPSSGTVLTILGGLLPEDTKGLQILHLPAFIAPSALLGAPPAQLREAYKASILPAYKTFLSSDTAPEDFFLLTSDPFYGQSQDPHAIVLLLSPDLDLPKIAPHTERGFIAYTFPPAPLTEPTELELPVELHLVGSQAVLHTEAITLPNLTYKRLVEDKQKNFLPLDGGSGSVLGSSRAGRMPPVHHAVLTVHLDMSIRIWDYTTPTPNLLDSFNAREALSDDQLGAYLEGRVWVEKVSAAWETIEMALALSTGGVLLYRFASAKASTVIERQERDQAEHHTTHSASRADTSRLDLEMAAAAQYMGLNESQSGASSSGFFGRKKTASNKGKDRTPKSGPGGPSYTFEIEVSDISGMSDWTKDGFKPVLSVAALSLRHQSVSCLSLSEAGFLAMAWTEQLAIIDLRGPEVLYNEGSEGAENGGIALLTWAVCGEGEDSERYPRLLVSYISGLTRILTLSYILDTWIINTTSTSFEHTSLQRPLASFIFDPHGNSSVLNATTLDDCLRDQDRQTSSSSSSSPHHSQLSQTGSLHTILIMVSELSLNVKANVTGDRLLKRDFTGTKAVAAKIVRKYGMPVLVVVMQDGQCVIFSLPKCEPVKTLHLNYERARISLSPDGRILQSLSPTLFQLSTLFADQSRTGTKSSYHDLSRVLGAQPTASYVAAATTAAASYVSSWFTGTSAAKTFTPNHLDDILAGPNRPTARLRRPNKVIIAETSETGSATSSTSTTGIAGSSSTRTIARKPAPAPSISGPGSFFRSSSGTSIPRALPNSIPTGSSISSKTEEIEYNAFGMPKKRHELTDALNERGEKLDFLNEGLEKASQASLDFVSQAKKMAMMQGAKSVVQGGAKGAIYGIGKMFD